MGKNGDQIGRLLSSDAQVFFVVYHSKVDRSVFEQMHAFALGRSLSGHRVHYGVVFIKPTRSNSIGSQPERVL